MTTEARVSLTCVIESGVQINTRTSTKNKPVTWIRVTSFKAPAKSAEAVYAFTWLPLSHSNSVKARAI